MSIAATSNQIAVFLLVVARVSGLVLSAPITGDMQVPRFIKATVAISLSLVLIQLPHIGSAQAPVAMLPFIVAALAQLLVGLSLGLVARALFWAVQAAGQIVSLQAGLSIAAVLNPLTKESEPSFAQLYTIIAALAFLAVDGESWVVASLARSFDLVGFTAAGFSPSVIMGVVTAAMAVTQLGLQLALPLGASLIAANIVLGVVSRAIPQLNVFVLSQPLNVLLSLLALTGSVAGTVLAVGHLAENLPQAMLHGLGSAP